MQACNNQSETTMCTSSKAKPSQTFMFNQRSHPKDDLLAYASYQPSTHWPSTFPNGLATTPDKLTAAPSELAAGPFVPRPAQQGMISTLISQWHVAHYHPQNSDRMRPPVASHNPASALTFRHIASAGERLGLRPCSKRCPCSPMNTALLRHHTFRQDSAQGTN